LSSPNIVFGTDGWRAIIGEDFSSQNVQLCAQGVADYILKNNLGSKGMVVGYDTRFGSKTFANDVAQVFAANQIPVFLSSNFAPTPVISYNVITLEAAGAVIITASHNAAEWNGFKVKSQYGGSASVDVINEIENNIREFISDGKAPKLISLEQGKTLKLIQYFDPKTSYLEHITSVIDFNLIKSYPIDIAIDSMFGAAIGYIKDILSGYEGRIEEIHSTEDSTFPGLLKPEPIGPNLRELRDTVLKGEYAIGLATDGDGDRIGVIDNTGRYLSSLQVFSLLTHYLLETKQSKDPVIKSITTSKMIDKLGKHHGTKVINSPVGFKYLGALFMENDALIAGEESGGFAFKGHIPERDGILSGLFLIEALAQTKLPLSDLLDKLYELVGPHYYDRLDLTFPERERPIIEQKLKTTKVTNFLNIPVSDFLDIDGYLYTLIDDSWVLVRFSGTEPLLRIYAESSSIQNVNRLIGEARNLTGI
jgi:phosphomannomutase